MRPATPAHALHTLAAMSCRKPRGGFGFFLPFRPKEKRSNLGAGIENILCLPSRASIDVGLLTHLPLGRQPSRTSECSKLLYCRKRFDGSKVGLTGAKVGRQPKSLASRLINQVSTTQLVQPTADVLRKASARSEHSTPGHSCQGHPNDEHYNILEEGLAGQE